MIHFYLSIILKYVIRFLILSEMVQRTHIQNRLEFFRRNYHLINSLLCLVYRM